MQYTSLRDSMQTILYSTALLDHQTITCSIKLELRFSASSCTLR